LNAPLRLITLFFVQRIIITRRRFRCNYHQQLLYRAQRDVYWATATPRIIPLRLPTHDGRHIILLARPSIVQSFHGRGSRVLGVWVWIAVLEPRFRIQGFHGRLRGGFLQEVLAGQHCTPRYQGKGNVILLFIVIVIITTDGQFSILIYLKYFIIFIPKRTCSLFRVLSRDNVIV